MLELSASEDVDVLSIEAGDVEAHSSPHVPAYEELVEVVTCAVARLNISWPSEKQEATVVKSKAALTPNANLASKTRDSRLVGRLNILKQTLETRVFDALFARQTQVCADTNSRHGRGFCLVSCLQVSLQNG